MIETMEKVIRIFDSFEEADAEDALSRARMSSQERVDISSNFASEPIPMPLS
jgi:hypothetical protein